jgi:hypothetical protein
MLGIVTLVILTTAASTLCTSVLTARSSKNLHVVTNAEWEQLQRDLIAIAQVGKATLEVIEKLPTPEQFNRVRSLAESAATICEGMIPDSGIAARSFDGATVVTGMKG